MEMFFAKKESKLITAFCQKILIESPLTVLRFVTVGVTKSLLTKVGISIDVIEHVSAMRSIELSPNLAAI